MRWHILLLVLVWPLAATAQDPSRQIVVAATGTVSATPDMAVVNLGVSREARTAAEALEGVSTAAAQVLERIGAAGIAPRDVQTASLSLYPVMDQTSARPPQVRGYVASNDLTIRVRDLSALGGLLDTLVKEGANNLSGISFAMSDPKPLEAQARAAAVTDARAKAQTLAEAAGVVLGPVQSIQESGGFVQPALMMRGAMMEAAVPVASGELEVSVTVTVVFAIE
jgi:uncharacterized protein YggE